MALTDLTRISTSGIATGSTIDSPILRKDVNFRGSQVGVTSALFDSSDDALEFNDNVKLKFGNSGDLELYHDTSNGSYIKEAGPGALRIQGDAGIWMQSTGNQDRITADNDAVNLFSGGTKRFNTTSTGAVVTGILTASSFSGPISNPSGISTFYDLRVTNNLTVEGTTTTLDTNLIDVDRVEIGANSNTNTAIVGIQSGTADIVNLFDGTTEVLTVKDGGNIGIGTTNPVRNLTIHGGSGDAKLNFSNVGTGATGTVFGANSNGNTILWIYEDKPFYVATNNQERLRITSTGALIKGNNGSKVSLGNGANTQIIGNSSADSSMALIRTAQGGGEFYFAAGSSGTNIANNNGLGFIKFMGYHTNGYDEYARIQAYVDGTNGDGDAPGRLSFRTTPAGSATSVERLRIKSTGYVGINTTGLYPLDVLEPTNNAGLISITGANTGYDTGFLIRNGSNAKWYLINDVNGTGGHTFEIRGDGWSNDRFFTLTQAGKVGIGTDDPQTSLHLYGGASGFRLERETSNPGYFNTSISHGTPVGATNYGSAYFTLSQTTGDYVWRSSTNERMRLKGNGKLGIGTDNPSGILHVKVSDSTTYNASSDGAAQQYGGATLSLQNTDSTANNYCSINFLTKQTSTGGSRIVSLNSGNNESTLTFITESSGTPGERLRITSDGQIGVNNASPDAWHSTYRSIQIYDGAVLYGSSDDSFVGLGANHFLNTSGDFKYSNTDFASRFYQVNGGFHFETAASGTAGNTFSFSEKFRITSGGTIAIQGQGSSNANPRLLIEDGDGGDNDFSISQYEDGSGTYTLVGQNIQLNSSGNNTVLDSNHKTAGIMFDGRNNGSLMFITGDTNVQNERLVITKEGQLHKKRDPVNRTSLKSYGTEGLWLDQYQYQVGSTYRRYSDIVSVGDATWGGHIRFLTQPDGDGNAVERLYIDQNGSVIVASGKLHSSRVQAKFGIDCHTLDIFDGVNDPSNYGMVFYNDPTTDKANGIGFFNDDGQSCGGYIVHQDRGGSNIGDIIFATSASANTPVERLRIGRTGVVHVNSVANGQAVVAFGDPTGDGFQEQNRIGGDTIYVADETISSAIYMPRQGCLISITGFSDTSGVYPQPDVTGLAYLDMGASRNVKICNLGSDVGYALRAKSAYTGTITDSDDTKLTLMAGDTQGTFRIVNRMGNNYYFQITFL